MTWYELLDNSKGWGYIKIKIVKVWPPDYATHTRIKQNTRKGKTQNWTKQSKNKNKNQKTKNKNTKNKQTNKQTNKSKAKQR